MIEALCQLSPGEFKSVVAGMNIAIADLEGESQREHAASVYRRVNRPGSERERKLTLLKSLIQRYYPSAFEL